MQRSAGSREWRSASKQRSDKLGVKKGGAPQFFRSRSAGSQRKPGRADGWTLRTECWQPPRTRPGRKRHWFVSSAAPKKQVIDGAHVTLVVSYGSNELIDGFLCLRLGWLFYVWSGFALPIRQEQGLPQVCHVVGSQCACLDTLLGQPGEKGELLHGPMAFFA